MINDWPKYLATEFNYIIPGSAQDAMYSAGGIEILAGLVVAIAPRFGSLLVAGWLGGIIVSLLLVGGYADIALRDFGLLLGRADPVPARKRLFRLRTERRSRPLGQTCARSSAGDRGRLSPRVGSEDG